MSPLKKIINALKEGFIGTAETQPDEQAPIIALPDETYEHIHTLHSNDDLEAYSNDYLESALVPREPPAELHLDAGEIAEVVEHIHVVNGDEPTVALNAIQPLQRGDGSTSIGLTDFDRYLFSEGTHLDAYEKLGAHLVEHNGQAGAHFAFWAPNASRVSVVGDFNHWDGNANIMQGSSAGVWQLFVPGLQAGTLYKYELHDQHGNMLPLKTDPYAFSAELRPATASRIARLPHVTTRAAIKQSVHDPISIYEVHLGSWQRGEGNRWLTYSEIAERLIPYAVEMGFTHLEFMPVSEHPFDGSWGYQPIGLFAPSSRFGTPEEFAALVERAHAAGLGILLDWVPGHFPNDAHGLGFFDGTHLYEHTDPREGFHQDWNTLIYNYGRTEVANFLITNALFWFDKYGVDGMRVDAVASMLYRDYSRNQGEWIPNQYGGRENLEAVSLLKRFNEAVYARFPNAVTVAEESTSWPGVSKPTYNGGLGFGFKWNMGWMHDTLVYMSKDPVYRKYEHHEITRSMLYSFSENFILPLSHDEVVHGKGSLFEQMPGDDWQKFANLRAYYGFMFGHPGKKLLFMGCEFGQRQQWNHEYSLDWHLLNEAPHQGLKQWVQDLNHLYRNTPALHKYDCEPRGFEWLDSDNAEASTIAFMRRGENDSEIAIVVSNFTPVVRENYRIGVPIPGFYREALNSDAALYGGSNSGNAGGIHSEDIQHYDRPYSINITVPPLATVILTLESNQ